MPPRARASTKRSRPAKKSPRKNTTTAPELPTRAPGERVWLLELPWGGIDGSLPPGTRYYKALKAHAYAGASLPAILAPYASKPYSYQRWLEDDINGERGPGAVAPPKTPTQEQIDDARAIAIAAAANYRGVLVSNGVGTGKTIVALLAAKIIAQLRGIDTILITVDRPARSTIPSWRNTLASLGDDGLRWVIISTDGLSKLISPNGRPRARFGLVVNDEAHQFRHESQRTKYMRRINRLSEPASKAPFVLSITATPAHHPGDLGYLSSLYAQVHGDPPAEWSDFGKALAERGEPLVKSFGKWTWSPEAKKDPKAQQASIRRTRDVLLRHDPPLMINRQAPWGPPPFDVTLVELTPDQRRSYELEWGEFRRQMKIARSGNDVAKGLAALMRMRQKAAMLRVEHTVDVVKAELENGYQVLVATELVSTAAHPVAEMLEESGIPVARIYGGNPDLEEERLRFQRGEATVVVFNTATSINLQANEQLPDGSTATSTPRRGLFHQPRYSGILAQQVMGRAHRNHEVCAWSLLTGLDTIEHRAAEIMYGRLIASATSTDGDMSALASVAHVFGADWIPDSALGDALT